MTSLTDTELSALIGCARERLVVIAPGYSQTVADAIAAAWNRLGPSAVQAVVDPDPEICRLGLGDDAALLTLQEVAEELGTHLHQQRGLRVGLVITDETITVFSPTPLLVEAGARPGEKTNAIQFDIPAAHNPADGLGDTLEALNLQTTIVTRDDVEDTISDLEANPPVKFDLAQKVRVFNARFEFVDFELRGLSISRKTVRIPSDLIGLAKDSRAQKLLRSSFQLIEENSELSGERVYRLKQFIAKKYLIPLPGYGTVILRTNKADFEAALRALDRYVHRFQRLLKKKLQTAIDSNREILLSALVPTVTRSPPARWKRLLGEHPNPGEIERLLRSELSASFGRAEKLFNEMKVKAVFKGVTYESLSDPEFIRVAHGAIPSLDLLHDEFDAAKAKERMQ